MWWVVVVESKLVKYCEVNTQRQINDARDLITLHWLSHRHHLSLVPPPSTSLPLVWPFDIWSLLLRLPLDFQRTEFTPTFSLPIFFLFSALNLPKYLTTPYKARRTSIVRFTLRILSILPSLFFYRPVLPGA